MRRLALASALLACTSTSYAADHTVTAFSGPFRFEPATLTIEAGDTVTFVNGGGFHNAASDPGAITAFRCADGCDATGGNGDASSAAWSGTVTFPTPGTAGYHCEVHAGAGMTGTITVIPAAAHPDIDVGPTSLEGSADEGGQATTVFTIANLGTATLDWTADSSSADCDAPASVPWIALDPVSGSIAAAGADTDVTVTLDATGLVAGAYSANVCVHSNDSANDPLTLPVTFTVNTPDLIFDDGFDG